MNADAWRDPAREMAEGLADALERALAPGASALALKAARDVAQILDLEALDRTLAAFDAHAGHPLPPELEPLRGRLLRMTARVRDAGSDAAFREEAGELSALAEEAGALEWSHAAPETALATLRASDAFLDMVLPEAATRALGSVRLPLRVAAALRAALDWLEPEGGALRTPSILCEGSVLEITLPAAAPQGIEAAGRVLGSVGGSLTPAGGAGWTLRVPVFAARAMYLVVVQGDRTLALPWPAVLRVHMLPGTQIEERSAEAGIPLTVPFALAPATARELPVVTLALGLKRAWLVADRLIWRLAGDLDAETPTRVRTDDGNECELVDLERLLEPLPEPRLPLAAAPMIPPAAVSPLARTPVPVAAMPETLPTPIERVTATEPARSNEAPPLAAYERSREEPPALPREHVRERVIALTSREVMPLPIARTRAALPPLEAPTAARVAAPPPLEAPAAAPPPAAPRAPLAITPPAIAAPAPRPAPAPAPREAASPPVAPANQGSFATFLGGFAAAFGPAPGAPDPASPPARRALVAEDSFVASVFLTRLLESEGFEVHAVERADAMWALLSIGSWSLVCVDVELPDAGGESLLAELLRRVPAERGPALIALVRDEEDEALASRLGVSHSFRKPFDRDTVRRLLVRLRLLPRGVA